MHPKKIKTQTFITCQSPKRWIFFNQDAYCSARKNSCKCWACEEVGHYGNECQYRNYYKLSEALGTLHYSELSEEGVLDLALKKNKETIEIAMEDEYEESDYEDISHMINNKETAETVMEDELFVHYLSLINKVKHSGKSDLGDRVPF